MKKVILALMVVGFLGSATMAVAGFMHPYNCKCCECSAKGCS